MTLFFVSSWDIGTLWQRETLGGCIFWCWEWCEPWDFPSSGVVNGVFNIPSLVSCMPLQKYHFYHRPSLSILSKIVTPLFMPITDFSFQYFLLLSINCYLQIFIWLSPSFHHYNVCSKREDIFLFIVPPPPALRAVPTT